MEDYLNGKNTAEVNAPVDDLEEASFVDFDALLKYDDFEFIAAKLTATIYSEVDFMKKDTLDKFLDYIYFKIQTGYVHILHMAYPTKRMLDEELEIKIIALLNYHLYPEIIFRLLKFFTRNIHDPDTNLYIANLVDSDEIIHALYETFMLFKKDIFKVNPVERTLNVKRIQQFSSRSEVKLSSPLDNSAILKYVLEFLSLKKNLDHIFKEEDLKLSKPI